MPDIRIVARPNPLRADTVEAYVSEGETVNRIIPNVVESVSVQWNGQPFPRCRWDEPLSGGELTIVSTPRDDSITSAVLQIGMAAAAAYAASLVPGSYGLWAKVAVGAATPICGRLNIGQRSAP